MNKLTVLPRTLLSRNSFLKRLDFSHNELTTLNEGFLISQPNLTHLDISGNRILEMDGDFSMLSVFYEQCFLSFNLFPKMIFVKYILHFFKCSLRHFTFDLNLYRFLLCSIVNLVFFPLKKTN